jgi:hypothetical protein
MAAFTYTPPGQYDSSVVRGAAPTRSGPGFAVTMKRPADEHARSIAMLSAASSQCESRAFKIGTN